MLAICVGVCDESVLTVYLNLLEAVVPETVVEGRPSCGHGNVGDLMLLCGRHPPALHRAACQRPRLLDVKLSLRHLNTRRGPGSDVSGWPSSL